MTSVRVGCFQWSAMHGSAAPSPHPEPVEGRGRDRTVRPPCRLALRQAQGEAADERLSRLDLSAAGSLRRWSSA